MAMNDQQAFVYLDELCAALGGAKHDMASRRADGLSNGYVVVTLPDGTAFSFKWGGYAYKDRIRIGTSYPQQKTSGGYMRHTIQRDFDRSVGYGCTAFDGITVAESKTPEKAAKDIERRFLPTYRPLYAMAVEYAALSVVSYNKREETKARAEKARRAADGHHVYVKNVHEDSVNVELSVTIDQLERLCAFLAEGKAEDTAAADKA